MSEWRERAACRPGGPVPPELFWPDQNDHATAALALHVCRAHCPVREPCDREEGPRATHPCVVGGRRYTMISGRTWKVQESRVTLPSRVGCPLC